MFTRANLEKFETGKFYDIRECLKFSKITHLADETCCGNLSDSFQGKDKAAVRNFIEMVRQCFLKCGDKALRSLYEGHYFSYFEENASFARLNTGRFPGSFIKCAGTFLAQFSTTGLSQSTCQGFKIVLYGILRCWVIFQKILRTLGFYVLHYLQKLGKTYKDQIVKLVQQGVCLCIALSLAWVSLRSSAEAPSGITTVKAGQVL